MALPLIMAGIGALGSAIGTGIQNIQNANADEIAEKDYNQKRGTLITDKYTNPLDLVANKALLSQMDRRLNKQEEAVANQAAAGGATFENVLAAKQASNEAMADVVSGVMQGETARQDEIRQQLLNLDSQRAAQRMAIKQQSGANWANMFNNLSGSLTTLGGAMIENPDFKLFNR